MLLWLLLLLLLLGCMLRHTAARIIAVLIIIFKHLQLGRHWRCKHALLLQLGASPCSRLAAVLLGRCCKPRQLRMQLL
jgi:hypothetical protein